MTKFLKKAAATTLLLMLSWLYLPNAALASEAQLAPKTIYSLADPVGDEKGAGKYTYPISPVFAPGKGLFDLTKFTLQADLEAYYFQLSFGAMNNPWGAPEGFSHQRIAIYIDTIANQGRTEPLREGAFVEFASNYGWEYLLDIQGWNHSRIFYYTDEKAAQGNKEIEVKLLPGTQTIQAKIPRKLLDQHPETWKFYVLVGAQDGLGPDGFRQILGKSTEWQFGGGTDTYYDPNVLDMLVPVGYQYSQQQMLSSYSVDKGKLALLYPVIPPKLLAELPEQKGKFAQVLETLVAPFGVILEEYPLADYLPMYIAASLAVLIIMTLIIVNWYRYKHPE